MDRCDKQAGDKVRQYFPPQSLSYRTDWPSGHEELGSPAKMLAGLMLLKMRENQSRIAAAFSDWKIRPSALPKFRELLKGSPLRDLPEIKLPDLSPHDLRFCWVNKIIEPPPSYKPWQVEHLRVAISANIELANIAHAIIRDEPWTAGYFALLAGMAVTWAEFTEAEWRTSSAIQALPAARLKREVKTAERRNKALARFAEELKSANGNRKAAAKKVAQEMGVTARTVSSWFARARANGKK